MHILERWNDRCIIYSSSEVHVESLTLSRFSSARKKFVSICVEGFSQNNVEEEEDDEDAT